MHINFWSPAEWGKDLTVEDTSWGCGFLTKYFATAERQKEAVKQKRKHQAFAIS